MFPKLSDFFVSYGSYHHHPVNQLIHIIFIPQIVFTIMCMLKHTAPLYVINGIEIDWGFILLAFLLFAYYNIDFVTAVICTFFYGGLWYLSSQIYADYQSRGELDQHFRIFLIQHIVSWISQFIGHGVFEKRNPALVDNLLLTLVAPAFVVLEILFKFGYKKEIFDDCEGRIKANIKDFQESKASAKKANWALYVLENINICDRRIHIVWE